MKNTTKPGCCCFLIFLYSFMKPHWHNKHYCCILYWYITTLLYFVTWLERTICHSDAWMWLRSQLKHFSQKDNYLITFCSPAVWVGCPGEPQKQYESLVPPFLQSHHSDWHLSSELTADLCRDTNNIIHVYLHLYIHLYLDKTLIKSFGV